MAGFVLEGCWNRVGTATSLHSVAPVSKLDHLWEKKKSFPQQDIQTGSRDFKILEFPFNMK